MPTGQAMERVTVDDNYYTRLGLPLGASQPEVEAAFVELDSAARAAGDAELSERLEEAHRGLTHPAIRSYHHQQIRWAAARDWYDLKYPGGRSVEEHKHWAEYRQQVIEEEPSLWDRIRGVFDGE